MRAVRVNETKLDSGTTLLDDLSAVVGEKESKYDKGTVFWGSPQSLNYSLSTLFQNTHLCVFLYYFSFRLFFGILSSLNIAQKFR